MGIKLDEAVRAGRTLFRNQVMSAPRVGTKSKYRGVSLRALKWAGGNVKLGGVMEKGPATWRGAPMFTLTLEERNTCWSGCQRWHDCYGSNMMWARRYKVNAALFAALKADLAGLANRFPVFATRLHVLGDFASVEYVAWWADQVEKYPGLRIWGYTHWRYASDIGRAVTQLVLENTGRVSILRSDPTEANDPLAKAWVVPDAVTPAPGTVFCPEETNRAESCATCGLCMNGRVSVSFIDHGPEAVRKQESIRRAAAAAERRALPVLATR